MFCSNEQFSISCRSSFQVNALFSLSSVLLKKLNDYRPPALIINDLPDDLDAVFISHNHYDHLDYPSVKELNKRYGERLTWFCGLGTRQWFLDNHIKNVVELDWWEEYHFSV
jgi:L-ascorbate metabolism protein UlaG (beta-lactamase superfamily)